MPNGSSGIDEGRKMGLTEELKRVLKESGAALVKVSNLRKVDKCSWRHGVPVPKHLI